MTLALRSAASTAAWSARGAHWSRLAMLSTALAVSAAGLGGCAAAVVGAAAGTALSAADRRTTATQLEDQLIELKARNRVRELMPDRGNVSTTSYNRILLITGEVPNDADRAATEQSLSKIDAVRSVVNELAVREPAPFSSTANDTAITGKVKASFLEARSFPANAVKVVTQRGVVHLMGRVTEAEANKAADVARAVSGVMKVVKVFEPISQAEIDALPRTGPPGGN